MGRYLRSCGIAVLCALRMHAIAACAPTDTVSTVADTTSDRRVTFSAFVDVYYAYDLGHSSDDERPAFLYQYDRHNEVDLNLGLIRLDLAEKNVRATFGLMTGTYPQANLISEPELLRNIYEARVGLKLSRKGSVWLDAGVFSSHIGMESAIGLDNWSLTRSIIAENTPYYLSGAKVTWGVSEKLEIAGLFVNGWQRIRRVQNDIPCFGTQVLYTPRKGVQFNWSTFAGSDTPDSLGLYRLFNNLWCSYEMGKWGVRLGADVGAQEAVTGGWNTWAGGLCVLRRKLGERYFAVARAEYYADPEQVMVPTGTEHGLTTMGYSLEFDVQVTPDAMVRVEGRTFHGVDALFEDVHGSTRDNTAITTSIAVRF